MPKLLIQPPLGGIQRFTGLQNRPPYTAYSLLNMWPMDALTGHSILASRPPLTELTSPANFCTLLQDVSGITVGKPAQSFLGAFGGNLYWWNGTGFTAATGGVTVPSTTPVYAGTVFDRVYIPRSGAGTKMAVFNYATGNAATIVETAGTSPDDIFFIVDWNGAIVAITNDEPHLLQMSRVGQPLDWDYTVSLDDEYAAWSSAVTTPGGMGAPINAFIPQSDDSALISTVAGTFLLRGHPRRGGSFDRILDTYVLGQGAWAKGPDDAVYFLTPDGIYVQPPGQNTIPAPLSKDKIPEELLGLDYVFANPVVSMEYDSRWNGIMIQVRGAEEQAWRYDIKTGGFFREEFVGYPFVMMEHGPFITNQSSGVLLGGVELRFFDKFGEESFESGGLIGPVKISGSALEKSKILKLRSIFGTDTPTGTGILAIAVGLDSQDALNRALLGGHQYIIDLEDLKTNNGTCYPLVSGSSAVVEFSQGSGRIGFEGIELELEEAGANRMPRGTQIVPEGEDIDFTEPSNEFDDTNWVGYSEATPNTPNCTLPNHTLFVDLSELPDSWWDNVASPTGGDIRVTDINNIEHARDLVDFNFANRTGFLTLKMTQQSPPTPVRLWVGNPFVSDYAPADEFGQFNAYDSNWRAFYPFGGARSGGEQDRTQYLNHLTLTGADATCLVTGTIGVSATDYTTLDATNNYGRATASIPSTPYPTTFVVVAKDEDATSLPCLGLRDQSAPSTANVELTVNRTATHQRADSGTTDAAAAAAEAQSGSVVNSANFRHFMAVITSATSRAAYIDGGNEGTNTTSITIGNGVLDEIIIGKGSRSGLSASSTTADLCLAQVHDTARSECWGNYQEQMLDQDDFWNNWGEFVEVNDPDDINPPDPPPADVTTCPLGFITPVETGTWSGFCAATPDPPASNKANWVHWIDLSDMHASWWAAVASDGHDIRATDALNRFIPLDLIEFDAATDTGFAAVRLNQASGEGAEIRLWVGNATAITLTPCAQYGRYRVYDENWVGFWPSGGGVDRTGNRNDMTAFGSPTVGGVTGPIGNKATNFNGTTQYVSDSLSEVMNSYPSTFAAVIRTTNFTQQGAIISAVRSQFQSHNTLMHKEGTAPGRYSARADDITHDAVSTTTVSSNVWTHEAGMSANNVERSIVVSGGTQFFSVRRSLAQRQFARISIGARRTGAGDVFWPFAGDICLASAHNALRSDDNSWAAYQNAMLDQNAFYNLGGSTWAWTAEVSSLPQ